MSTETLMTTEAEQTPTEGQAASNPDTQAATGAAEGVQQQATEGQPAQAQAEGQQQEGQEQPKPEAPESYEFKPIDGVSVAPEVIERFSAVAKDLKLSQEAAQKVFEEMAPAIQAHQVAQVQAVTAEWAKQSTADPEFGGEKLQENLAVAKKALDTFGTPELRNLLNESGLGNHPDVIRFMYRAGRAISEDKFVVAGASQAKAKDPAEILFGGN